MRKLLILSVMVLTLMSIMGASAQDDGMMGEPMVAVSDQLSLNGSVVVDEVYSDGPGFIVIHTDNEGSPGPVSGWAALPSGHSRRVVVDIDTSIATPVLYAMLHTDTGEVGVYEFGTVEGADGPVRVDDAPITPPFNATIVNMNDQFAADNTVTVKSVVSAEAGWLVIHSGDAESPGPVLGASQVEAGTNTDVSVTLEGDVTSVVWPMLHQDTGEAGVYEFGTVEGADGPVRVNDRTATFPVWTVPHMRVADQIVVHGDNFAMEMMDDMAITVTADSVLSEGAGWLVIHSAGESGPGPVLGAAQVQDGLNEDVVVELEGDVTPTLYPMLHTDTGEAGVYEFGTVEGADGPVSVDGNVLVFPIDASPSIQTDGYTFEEGVLTISSALIDAPGWLVIHSSADGSPGPVLGQAHLGAGLNSNVSIEIDPEAAGNQVFPMLHYDTGEAGVYEFGSVEGADSPVVLGGSPVVLPLDFMN